MLVVTGGCPAALSGIRSEVVVPVKTMWDPYFTFGFTGCAAAAAEDDTGNSDDDEDDDAIDGPEPDTASATAFAAFVAASSSCLI